MMKQMNLSQGKKTRKRNSIGENNLKHVKQIMNNSQIEELRG